MSPTLATGNAALASTGTADPRRLSDAYVIGPSDELRVQVLYEPELTLEGTRVDEDGTVQVPLAGSVQAAGKTSTQLAGDIEKALSRYVLQPHVVVSIAHFAKQVVTVEGSVVSPGVYDVPGTSSLLQALALAKGPERSAKLDQVIVFRTVDGQRTGALFDVQRIRYGYAPDPLILGGDTVVVGFSEIKGAFRDFLAAAPAIGVFRPY